MAEDNNSLTRANERPSAEERRKELKQFTGVKQVRKKEPSAFWAWLARMFFSGRSLKDICVEVAENQIVPGIKDNVRNSLVSMIDMGIYKDHKAGAPANGVPGSFITNYVAYGDKKKQQNAALEATKQKEAETIKSGFENPAFANKKDADDFLMSMKAYVQKYETLSVQDLAWMQGKSIDFTWDKWGWWRDEILAIKAPVHINNPTAPWMIDMPKAHEFD